MIALWAYHWRMGRYVERLFRMAYFDRLFGPDHMQNGRANLKFTAGERWSDEQIRVLSGRR